MLAFPRPSRIHHSFPTDQRARRLLAGVLRSCLIGTFAFGLLAISPLPAAAEAATQTPAPVKAGATKVLMWSVRSATATVYLLGSVHVGSPDAYPLDPRIEQAFSRADTLVLEVPMDDASIGQARDQLQRAGLYSPPDSLDKHLDPATLDKLKRALSAIGLPLEPFLAMRPWFVATSLTLLRLQAQGFRPELGIDMHFNAALEGRHFDAIETVAEQTAMLSSMPDEMQLDNLRQTLEELDDLSKVMQDAFDAWKRGDGAAIDKLMLAPVRKRYPELYRRLFVDRNRRMAAAVERYLSGKGTVFVVVGAGHLVGKDSVLQLLKAHGFNAKQQ